jgi:hypothetical protein
MEIHMLKGGQSCLMMVQCVVLVQQKGAQH